ncbi:MAG: hypothetical protein ACKKL5_02190 [Candidatus Komeilibacteria bacterium]
MSNRAHINLIGLLIFIFLILVIFGYIIWQSAAQKKTASVTLSLPTKNYQVVLHYPDKTVTLYRVGERMRLEADKQADIIIDLRNNQQWLEQDGDWLVLPPFTDNINMAFDPYQLAMIALTDKQALHLQTEAVGLTGYDFYVNNQSLRAYFSSTGLVQRIEYLPSKKIYIYYDYARVGDVPENLLSTNNGKTED